MSLANSLSSGNLNWTTIGRVKGAGNSSATLNYEFTDNYPFEEMTGNGVLYYRLRQTDYDGKYEYFNPISVRCNSSENIVIYPTISSGQFQILGSLPDASNLEVYNMLGEKVYGQTIIKQQTANDSDGSSLITINLPQIKNGIYFCRLKTGHGTITKKLIVQK